MELYFAGDIRIKWALNRNAVHWFYDRVNLPL